MERPPAAMPVGAALHRGSGFPPGCPIGAQARAASLGALVGGKKSDEHMVPLEHSSHQWGNAHMACVNRQINGFGTSLSKPDTPPTQRRKDRERGNPLINAKRGRESKHHEETYLR